jgi:hypothetical protein
VLNDVATISRSDLIADFSDAHALEWESYRRQCTTWSRMYLDELPPLENLYVTLVGYERRDGMVADASTDRRHS